MDTHDTVHIIASGLKKLAETARTLDSKTQEKIK